MPAAALLIAAPPPPAWFRVNLESTISTRPARGGTSGSIGQSYCVGSAWLIAPPPACAKLRWKVTRSILSVPFDQFWIAPPSSTLNPSRIVMLLVASPWIVTAPEFGWISKMRSRPGCSSVDPSRGKPPSMVTLSFAASFLIVTGAVMSMSPVPVVSSLSCGISSSYVPESRAMVSRPEVAFDSMIAARSEHVLAVVRHWPSPTLTSMRSAVSFTSKVVPVAASAPGRPATATSTRATTATASLRRWRGGRRPATRRAPLENTSAAPRRAPRRVERTEKKRCAAAVARTVGRRLPVARIAVVLLPTHPQKPLKRNLLPSFSRFRGVTLPPVRQEAISVR